MDDVIYHGRVSTEHADKSNDAIVANYEMSNMQFDAQPGNKGGSVQQTKEKRETSQLSSRSRENGDETES